MGPPEYEGEGGKWDQMIAKMVSSVSLTVGRGGDSHWFVLGSGSSLPTTTAFPSAQGQEPEAQKEPGLGKQAAWAQVSIAQQLCDLGQVTQSL